MSDEEKRHTPAEDATLPTSTPVDVPDEEPELASSDDTIPSHATANVAVVPGGGQLPSAKGSATSQVVRSNAPWTLQQFFDGEIDLDVELAKRFPNMPVLSQIAFRSLGRKSQRGVATLTTQDGAATLVVDVDASSGVVLLSFTFGSMLTLRFRLDDLSDMDRARWVELMRREQGGLAFLWGQARWESDYVICISRKYYTNLYAFSPHRFEAAVRLTPAVMRQLLDWLETHWKRTDSPHQEPPQLLTW